MRYWACLGVAGLTVLIAACDSTSPTAPDTRTGVIDMRIVTCDPSGRSPLECKAQTFCSGPYRCPDPSANERDITELGRWISRTPDVVLAVGPGRFQQIGVGDGLIAVFYRPEGYHELQAERPVSVFPGTAPLPTILVRGTVLEAGKTATTGGIQGAVVRVIDGLIAGRTAVTGVAPQPVPGFVAGPLAPNRYVLLGVPPGRYRVRTDAEGYFPLERVGTVTDRIRWDDNGTDDFQLVRR